MTKNSTTNNKLLFTNIDDESDKLEVELDYSKYTYDELNFLLNAFVHTDYRTCISKSIEFLFKDSKISSFINNSIEFDEAIRNPNELYPLCIVLLGVTTDRYNVEFNVSNGNINYPYKLTILGEEFFITDLLRGKDTNENEYLTVSEYIFKGEYIDGFRDFIEDHSMKQPEPFSMQELYGAYLFLPFIYGRRRESVGKKKKKS